MINDEADVRDIDTGTLPDRYARGWHCLGPAKTLLDGTHHEVDIFGMRLAISTNSAGSASITGVAEGDQDQPEVPWHSDIRGGLLFVWHDHERNPPNPDLRIPEIAEWASGQWTDWRWNATLIEGSNCREIIDNVADMAHFFYIHFGLPTFFKNVFDGHIAAQYLHNVGRPDIEEMGATYGGSHLDSEAIYFGPSFMVNWLHNSYDGFKSEAILVNCHYPISHDAFVLQWGVIVEKIKGLDDATTDSLSAAMTDGVSRGFMQDVEIWKHKTRIDNPLLVEEDGPVYQLRRWYEQFYVDIADIIPDMTDRFEHEVDTTTANEKWHREIEENLRLQASACAATQPEDQHSP